MDYVPAASTLLCLISVVLSFELDVLDATSSQVLELNTPYLLSGSLYCTVANEENITQGLKHSNLTVLVMKLG